MDKPKLPEYLSCEQIRKIDQYAIEVVGISGLVLMENAARNCVELLTSQSIRGKIIVVCGKGNNGGDGFAMVRLFLIKGFDAMACLVGDPESLQGDAKQNYEFLQRGALDNIRVFHSITEELEDLLRNPQTEWVVDALLGTGTTGQIREPFSSVIESINSADKKVFSVDIPSGLNGDTGETLGPTIQADLTGTFVASKTGFQSPAAAPYLGQVHVLDIGLTQQTVLDALDWQRKMD